MTESISTLKSTLENSLDDLLISRRERRDIRAIIQGTELTNHQKKVLLSDAKNMVMERLDSSRSSQLLEWFYEAVKLLSDQPKVKNGKPTVYFSPGTACRGAICSQIRFAKRILRICVFTISDDEITEELLAAQRRGIDIRILTDDDKSFDKGSDIERLKRSGIAVKMDNSPVHMHHKFALIDEDTLLTGSYNWTRSAATHNYENIILLKDAHTFKAYDKEFEKLWKTLKSKA